LTIGMEAKEREDRSMRLLKELTDEIGYKVKGASRSGERRNKPP